MIGKVICVLAVIYCCLCIVMTFYEGKEVMLSYMCLGIILVVVGMVIDWCEDRVKGKK